MRFTPGQRWQSTTEPELGLGIVALVEGREVVIEYPARDLVRRYAIESAPLVRARLSEGQEARAADGTRFRVEEVVEEAGLVVYRGGDRELLEQELDAKLDTATPENRLRNAQVDDHRLFQLRHDALVIQARMLASPARGFLGGRIRLFDHQLSIARDACGRHRVRVLLADEVGLGKTIEALLILHRLLLTGRVERALVVVPPALVHQWLAEAYLRFNLVLRVIGRDTAGGDAAAASGAEDVLAALKSSQLFVCPLGVEGAEALVQEEWDFLAVDEAHHLEPGSDNFALVEKLAARVEHVVFLSATPDRDGEAGHLRRLRLLDPARFADEAAYRAEAEHYRELADTAERLQGDDPLIEEDRALLRQRLAAPDVEALLDAAASNPAARRKLLGRLLDLHGIGRVMFRNVRARIPGFPRRVSHRVALAGDAGRAWREFLHDIGRDDAFELVHADRDPRTLWLRELLDERAGERVLVLCATRAKAEAFAGALAAGKRDIARFHEDMSSIERDRQAAWFLAPDGPQVLVSSAIGAEGRNFQVAEHLVLLDLPLQADRLEQRIGRLDRIGQSDEVHIWTPVVGGTPQERLCRWFAEALHVFDRPWHGSPVIERELRDALLEALLAPDDDAVEEVIASGGARNERTVEELESGRDRLLELTSFDVVAARELRAAIHDAEESSDLEAFMVDAFERAGLDVTWIGKRSYAVRAGASYHRPFPGFAGSEMGVTFDRAIGLEHPERVLLTWDHPMVRDTVDSVLAHEAGNASVARLGSEKPGLLLEALYVAEPTLARELRADRFLPPTLVRIVVDASGREVDLDVEVARDRVGPADPALLEDEQVAGRLGLLIGRTRELATSRGPGIAGAARERMRRELQPSVERLEELAERVALVDGEIEAARSELATLDAGLQDVRVRLEGLRVIVTGPE